MFFFITMIIAGLSTALPLRKKRDVFLGVAAMAICAFIEFLWYYIFREAFLAEPYTVIWENIHEKTGRCRESCSTRDGKRGKKEEKGGVSGEYINRSAGRHG